MVASMKRRPFQMQQVLLFANNADSSTDVVTTQLEEVGLTVLVVMTPGEVVWRLQGGEEYLAIMIDVDHGLPDRYELVNFLQQMHPDLPRLFLMTSPAVAELEGCRVADKRNLAHDVQLALAA
jgi:CheY-like chemotaxis protein